MCGNCNYVLSGLSLFVDYLIKFYIWGGDFCLFVKYIYNFVLSLVDCIYMMLVLGQVGRYRYYPIETIYNKQISKWTRKNW